MTELNISEGFTCPAPIQAYDRIVSGHGSGGKMTADLIEDHAKNERIRIETLLELEKFARRHFRVE